MDDIPKKPPRPMLQPEKPSAADLNNPTPEKIRHVTFQDEDLGVGHDDDFHGDDSHKVSSISIEGRLDQPQLQSTYLLQNQMENLLLKHKQLDQHCKQQLQMLDSNQTHVNDKVLTLLNFGKNSLKYNNLTSLEVDESDVALLSVKPRIPRPTCTRQEVNEEDIMEFFTSDLITETPALELDIMDTTPNEAELTELPEFSFDFLFELYRTQEKTQ